jgi:serine/threonine-protein kinase RsbW
MSPDPSASSQPTVIRLELPAEHRYLNVVGACAAALLARAPGLQEADIVNYNVELALQEACSNLVDHAYAGQPGRIVIEFGYTEGDRQLTVDLYDTGRPFDPQTAPEPALDGVQVRGYGLFLIRNLMDEVSYEAEGGRNHWRLVKNLEFGGNRER